MPRTQPGTQPSNRANSKSLQSYIPWDPISQPHIPFYGSRSLIWRSSPSCIHLNSTWSHLLHSNPVYVYHKHNQIWKHALIFNSFNSRWKKWLHIIRIKRGEMEQVQCSMTGITFSWRSFWTSSSKTAFSSSYGWLKSICLPLQFNNGHPLRLCWREYMYISLHFTRIIILPSSLKLINKVAYNCHVYSAIR